MHNFLKDFFVEHQPTEQDVYRKAEQVGFTLEETSTGYTLDGYGPDGYNANGFVPGKPATWHYTSDELDEANNLLDTVNSVAHEYGVDDYYEEEYKPGWKRWLGL